MILLKNCFHILQADNDRSFEGFDVLIKDNRIERIAKSIEPDKMKKGETRVIDCSAMVVVPGFVNTHHHFYQVLTRNVPEVQNAKLFDWLVYLYEVWKNIDEEAVFYSSLAAMGELLKTGCTCTTDHHYLYPAGFRGDLTGIQFDAAEKLGMRFSPCRGSMSRSKKDGGLPPDSVVQTEEEILKDSLRVIEKYHDSSDFSMRRVVLAPCSPFSVTEGLLRKSVGLAREQGVRIHTHLAETADEDDYCLKTHNMRPLALMEEVGFLGEDVSFAHGIFFNDDEIKMLAETQTSIAHCPSSNMRLGSGIARIKDMLNADVNVAIGVDGSASNDSSDFLGEMRHALLLQRVKDGAGALTTREVFEMATINGARLLGFNMTGRIKEGWAADMALFNIKRLEYAGSLSDPVSALVFAGISHQAEYTIVNGRIAVEKGMLSGFDEGEILLNVNRISSSLLKQRKAHDR